MTQNIATAGTTPIAGVLCRGRRLRGRPSEAKLNHLHAARLMLLGELATTIGHEVSQPLAAIGMDAETLLNLMQRPDTNDAKMRQIIERVATSAARAGNMVARIRDMGRKQEVARQQINLNQIVTQSELLVRPHIEAQAVGLEMTLDPALPDIIGDPIQLEQVVVNLLVNCLQAMSGGGGFSRLIEVRTSNEAGKAVVRVRDTGPGISAEERDHIFESFYSTKTRGLGIGLPICRSILDLHRGGITARNHPDGGAEFQFWIPIQAATARRKCDVGGCAERKSLNATPITEDHNTPNLRIPRPRRPPNLESPGGVTATMSN